MSAAAITRRLKTGEWLRVYEKVFRLAAAPITVRQLWLAACLRRPGHVWLSHRGAALFWHLDGFDQQTVEVTTDFDIRSSGKLIVHSVPCMQPYDFTVVEGIPVTTVHRTLIDLGNVACPDAVELALESALRRRITTIARLYRRLEAIGTQGRKGAAVLRELLDGHSGRPTESILETRFVQFVRRRRIAMPERQVVVRDESGFVARVDFIYEKRKAIVEVDSRSHHVRRREWEADLRRRNRLTAEGYRVLHVTHERLTTDPGGIERELRKVLAA